MSYQNDLKVKLRIMIKNQKTTNVCNLPELYYNTYKYTIINI